MLNPSIALLVSIAVILILLTIKIHPGLTIFMGSLVISLLVLPLRSIPLLWLRSLVDVQTVRLLVVIASALTLSGLMEEKGLLTKLAATMESVSPRLAVHIVPAVIGLVPMPAGALISATAVRGLIRRLGLTPEQGTFINYWFRHIWEFSVPIYPAIIVTSAVLSLPLFTVLKTLAPMTALTILLGSVLSYGMLRKTPQIKGKATRTIAYNLLEASWPILLLIPLILLGLDAMIAFPVTLALLAVLQRIKWPELKKALSYGLNLKILFLLYAIMLYKATIESSGTASMLISDMQNMGLPASVMLVALPFLIGLATGFSLAAIGVTLPLLVPYIASDLGVNSYALLLAYASGMMGVFLSPMHLCLILSTEYFKANLLRMYRYILPITMIIEGMVIAIYYIAT